MTPAIRIDVDGTITEVPVTYDAISAGVGGWIESAPTDGSLVIYLDEEGKLKGLAINPLANMLWATVDCYGCIADGDYIVGPVVVTGPLDDDDGENTPVPESLLPLLAALAAEIEEAWS